MPHFHRPKHLHLNGSRVLRDAWVWIAGKASPGTSLWWYSSSRCSSFHEASTWRALGGTNGNGGWDAAGGPRWKPVGRSCWCRNPPEKGGKYLNASRSRKDEKMQLKYVSWCLANRFSKNILHDSNPFKSSRENMIPSLHTHTILVVSCCMDLIWPSWCFV